MNNYISIFNNVNNEIYLEFYHNDFSDLNYVINEQNLSLKIKKQTLLDLAIMIKATSLDFMTDMLNKLNSLESMKSVFCEDEENKEKLEKIELKELDTILKEFLKYFGKENKIGLLDKQNIYHNKLRRILKKHQKLLEEEKDNYFKINNGFVNHFLSLETFIGENEKINKELINNLRAFKNLYFEYMKENNLKDMVIFLSQFAHNLSNLNNLFQITKLNTINYNYLLEENKSVINSQTPKHKKVKKSNQKNYC